MKTFVSIWTGYLKRQQASNEAYIKFLRRLDAATTDAECLAAEKELNRFFQRADKARKARQKRRK